MIARLLGVALDARVAAASDDPRTRALAAAWIAANLLAAGGQVTRLCGGVPRAARIVGFRARGLADTLATIAAVPALLDPATLPLRWRLALRAVGMPLADAPAATLLAEGASVARLGAAGELELAVDDVPHARVVRVERTAELAV